MPPDLVALGRALSHPARVAILRSIDRRKLSVTDLARLLGVHHAIASYHLGRLFDAHLVTIQRDGRRRLYGRSDEGLRSLWALHGDPADV